MQRRHGGAAEPPSSTSEAGGRQEDVSQLMRFAHRPAGCWEMDCQQGGRAAPKGAGLLQLDGRGAAQPLQRRWGMHTSVRRRGGAPLHAAAPKARGTPCWLP